MTIFIRCEKRKAKTQDTLRTLMIFMFCPSLNDTGCEYKCRYSVRGSNVCKGKRKKYKE